MKVTDASVFSTMFSWYPFIFSIKALGTKVNYHWHKKQNWSMVREEMLTLPHVFHATVLQFLILQ